MNTGAIETHYHLEESSDSILTPDFRVFLPGPGEFNLAINSDLQGDTCVSSLAGSNASVVVAEVLGTGTYEVKPDQQVLFRQGRMQSVETPLTSCGCPAPQQPILRASADPTAVIREDKAGSKLALANSDDRPASPPGTGASAGNEKSAPEPAAQSTASENGTEEAKVQVSTPLVFNAQELMRSRAETSAAMAKQVGALPLSSRPANPLPPLVVLPPPVERKPEHKGFFSRIGSAFRAIF
jgi:hypothetical protein